MKYAAFSLSADSSDWGLLLSHLAWMRLVLAHKYRLLPRRATIQLSFSPHCCGSLPLFYLTFYPVCKKPFQSSSVYLFSISKCIFSINNPTWARKCDRGPIINDNSIHHSAQVICSLSRLYLDTVWIQETASVVLMSYTMNIQLKQTYIHYIIVELPWHGNIFYKFDRLVFSLLTFSVFHLFKQWVKGSRWKHRRETSPVGFSSEAHGATCVA